MPANTAPSACLQCVRDGAKVPVSLVYRKDKFKKDVLTLCINMVMDLMDFTVEPDFSSSVISLLDRGFV